jgi:HEAT repeat protein
MGLHFRTFLLLIVLTLIPAAAAAQSTTPSADEGRREWEQLRKRFNEPRSYNLITSGMWTLTHAGESKKEIEEVIRLLTILSDSFAKQDLALLKDVGGARGFKDRMAALLNSKDDVVAGFAATMLGISGDSRYSPTVAKLLDKKDPPEDDEEWHPEVSSRGRAAVALSLLGAREYVPKLVAMLGSPSRYDRSGAAIALGQLGAREHAKEVAAVLSDQRYKYEDDDSPIHALVEMGVAAEYVGEIAKVLQDEFRGETVETAAYALAKLGARQYAKDIARLLGKEFRKGDAAKALAVMGAAEYGDEIARMLGDKNPLNRKDALLALGVLNATKYAVQVAKHLKDPEGFVTNYAAYALVLMGSGEHADQVVPLVENAHRQNLYLNAGDFHPIVEEELSKIRSRFNENYLKMKARVTK